MPQPSRSEVHVNRPLTNISIAYMQDASAFIAAEVFPIIPGIQKRSDHYYVYPIDDFTRDEMQERASGSESAGSGYRLSHDTYFCRRWSLHKDIGDDVRANTDQPLDNDRDATEFLTRQGLIHRERTWVDSYFKQGVWDFETVGGAETPANFNPLRSGAAGVRTMRQWSHAMSDPIRDVRRLKQAILMKTGYMPNTLTMGRQAYDILLDNVEIIDRLDRGQTPGGPAIATRDALAKLFELERILVMDAIWNASDEGLDADIQFIGGKHALLSYRPPSPGHLTPSAGYTFPWAGMFGASAYGGRMKRFRMEHLESDRIEIDMAYDQKVTGTALACFLHDIA